MKKIISIALIAVLALALLAGCGSSAAPATTTALAPEAPAELSGTVATDGSTSMRRSSAHWAKPSWSRTRA